MREDILVDSHPDGLRYLGDLPEGEEQAYLLTVVREQGVTGGFIFHESLKSLNGLFNLPYRFVSTLYMGVLISKQR